MSESPHNRSGPDLLPMGKKCDLRGGSLCGVFPERLLCEIWGIPKVGVNWEEKVIHETT